MIRSWLQEVSEASAKVQIVQGFWLKVSRSVSRAFPHLKCWDAHARQATILALTTFVQYIVVKGSLHALVRRVPSS